MVLRFILSILFVVLLFFFKFFFFFYETNKTNTNEQDIAFLPIRCSLLSFLFEGEVKSVFPKRKTMIGFTILFCFFFLNFFFF